VFLFEPRRATRAELEARAKEREQERELTRFAVRRLDIQEKIMRSSTYGVYRLVLLHHVYPFPASPRPDLPTGDRSERAALHQFSPPRPR
jgi:hypothetical protein